ncbi:MAG: hypothetical protein HFH73_13425 [Lachnospiraceae bacterium]|nr:hypothetical protein [Lachnospiraceae bacterium]
MTRYPDFDIEQANALSFIMGCSLAQKAFIDPPVRNYTNIVRNLIEEADRLADNCHMPEFTNHALPHICSIVRRASVWGTADGWIDQMSSAEACYLLIALIIHDLGMLSQDAQDLPDLERISSRKGMSDLASWVRSTHVSRLPKLIRRLLAQYIIDDPSLSAHLDIIIQIAVSHGAWPWQEAFCHKPENAQALGMDVFRLRGLNAVVAVSDLLDEDSSRCDTATLIRHKHGSNLNISHWIRHALTAEVRDIQEHKVNIQFRILPDVPDDIEIVYTVLQNHYQLIRLYNSDLSAIGASISNIDFDKSRITDQISSDMRIWSELPDFRHCLIPWLLSTFEDEAKNCVQHNSEVQKYLDELKLKCVSLNNYTGFLSPAFPCTDEERILLHILKSR